MAIKAVLWDLGGVIVRTTDMAPRTTLAKRMGLSLEEINRLVFDRDDRFSAQMGEIDAEVHLDEISEELGISSNDLRQRFFGGDHLDDQLVAFIRALRPGRKTALLSNALSNLRSTITEDWKIADTST